MRHAILLNAMSRNGASLLYQLLAGHSELAFYPARIDIACSQPSGWPLYGELPSDPVEAFERLADKHFVDVGATWQTMRHTPLREVPHVDFAALRELALERFASLEELALPQVLVAFCESLLELEQISVGERRVVYQEDHLFNFGSERFHQHFPDMICVQLIRDLRDVIASRKNMLLYHNGFRGDPRTRTLKREVVEAEGTRWIWNVVCAALNRRDERYQVLCFEHLRGPSREPVLRALCERLELAFEPILLTESKAGDPGVHGSHGMLVAGSSLKQVTAGASSLRVKSHEKTLAPCELEWVDALEGQLGRPFRSDRVQPADVHAELERFVESNRSALDSHERLARWIGWHHADRLPEVMAEYSALNFGGARASESFLDS